MEWMGETDKEWQRVKERTSKERGGERVKQMRERESDREQTSDSGYHNVKLNYKYSKCTF